MPVAHFLWPRAWNNSLHCLIALAEGLQELGWNVRADGGNWKTGIDGKRLFEDAVPGEYKEVDLVVIDSTRLGSEEDLAPLASPHRQFRTIGIDMDDVLSNRAWYATKAASRLDLVLRCHYVDSLDYPRNVRPWAFGLSKRIIDLSRQCAGRTRSNRLIWNFQNQQYPHTARLRALERVPSRLPAATEIDRKTFSADDNSSEYDRLMFVQTGGRHVGKYYERLAASKAVACFGGWFLPSTCCRDWGYQLRLGRAWKRMTRGISRTIVQWDSWRWWEALMAGCVAVHFDFDHYRFRLPVMPIRNRHYLGIDLSNITSDFERTLSDEERCVAIGEAGRDWALEHYSPATCAQRLLSWLGFPA